MNDLAGLRASLAEWFDSRNPHGVEFRESVLPEIDRSDDYAIVYEAVFEPDDVTRSRIEIWVADDGAVAVGFETRERVAMRLGARPGRPGFAVGNEPVDMGLPGLLALLDCIADGELAINARSVLGVLAGVHAYVSPAVYEKLDGAGFTARWIRVGKSRSQATMLTYAPWSVH